MAVIPYIHAARAGRNHAWRYLATFFLVTLLVLLGTVIPQYLAQIEQSSGSPAPVPAFLLLAQQLFPYVFVPLGLWIGLSQLHHRSFYSLLNADWSFHWRRVFVSAGLWLLLLILADLLLAWLLPGRYAFTFSSGSFFSLLAAALLLIPIQAAGEEMLYRGYLTQAFGLHGGFWPALLVPSLLFALLHFNAAAGLLPLLPYLGISLLLGWVTLRSGGLELAIGFHVIHNLYSLVVVAPPHSALPTAALFTVRLPSGLAFTGAAEASPLLLASADAAGGSFPLEGLVFAFAGLLYIVLIGLLGREYFPLGLFGRPLHGLNRLTQPRAVNSLSGLLLLTAMLAATGCIPTAVPANTGQPNSGLVLEDCLLRTGQSQIRAECGKLMVYEDAVAASGKQIELNIALIRSVSREPAPDPLFLLAGGPGQAATETFPPLIGTLERVRFKRDLVMVDQRGTGQSNLLSCPVPDDQEQVIGVELPEEERLAWLESCRISLGIDPLRYSTENAARDLDQVRQALGYEQVNLLGVSYGTRAALTYLRMFPERVRTLVLDGVVPPNWVLGSSVTTDAQRALDLIFERCTQDSSCREAFPTLAEDFAALRARLADAPVEIGIAHPITGLPIRVLVSSTTLGTAVRMMSYSDLSAALLPLGIHTAAEGDYTLLASLYVQVTEDLDAGISTALNQSVICSEDAPLLRGKQDPEGVYLGPLIEDLVNTCQVWLPDAALPPPTRPQTWDTPALLISGEADPVTPPHNGAQMAAWLPNSTHLVLPGLGHSNFYTGCMPEILLRFLDRGSTADLDTACLETIQPMPFFLSPAGPPP
jgi:pimeloyl-ACP methyl ester carboxylesterase/membrane protease YdiL (CAAX protease family)